MLVLIGIFHVLPPKVTKYARLKHHALNIIFFLLTLFNLLGKKKTCPCKDMQRQAYLFYL